MSFRPSNSIKRTVSGDLDCDLSTCIQYSKPNMQPDTGHVQMYCMYVKI